METVDFLKSFSRSESFVPLLKKFLHMKIFFLTMQYRDTRLIFSFQKPHAKAGEGPSMTNAFWKMQSRL